MKTNLRKTNVSAYFNEIYIENELNNITNTIDCFNKIIKKNELTFNEYIDILNSLYNIEITNYDLLKISSIFFSGPCKSIILNTDILGFKIKQINKNNIFEYEEKEHLLDINVAFTNDDDINVNHKYSISEIIKLINENKIVVLDFIIDGNSYGDYNSDLYPLNNILNNNFICIKNIDKNYVHAITTFLNNHFTTDKLKQDLNEYICDAKDKLIQLEKYIENTKVNYNSKIKKYNNLSYQVQRIIEKK